MNHLDAKGLPDLDADNGDPTAGAQSNSLELMFWSRVQQQLSLKVMTHTELANRMGTTQPAVAQLLSRRYRPSREIIISLAAALGVAPQDLWPELEVAEFLDAVAGFHREQTVSDTEATVIRRTLNRDIPDAPAAPLTRRK